MTDKKSIQLQRDNIFQVVNFIEGKKPDVKSNMAADRWQDYTNLVRAKGCMIIKTLKGECMVNFGDVITKTTGNTGVNHAV